MPAAQYRKSWPGYLLPVVRISAGCNGRRNFGSCPQRLSRLQMIADGFQNYQGSKYQKITNSLSSFSSLPLSLQIIAINIMEAILVFPIKWWSRIHCKIRHKSLIDNEQLSWTSKLIMSNNPKKKKVYSERNVLLQPTVSKVLYAVVREMHQSKTDIWQIIA